MSLVDAGGKPIGSAEGGAVSVEVVNLAYRFAVPKAEILLNPDGVFEAILNAIAEKFSEVVSNVRLGRPLNPAPGAGVPEVQPGTGDASGDGPESPGTGGGELPLPETRDDSGGLPPPAVNAEAGALASTVNS